MRPFLSRSGVLPYTPEQLKAAALESDLDGPLVDYAAKGSKVEMEGTQMIAGKTNYILKVRLNNSLALHVWVDAQSFLETKEEGPPRRLDGKLHPTATYFSDYRKVDGLMIPFTMETEVEGVKQTESIQIESVKVNAKLEDALFTKPIASLLSH
jgi:hypothetical protein